MSLSRSLTRLSTALKGVRLNSTAAASTTTTTLTDLVEPLPVHASTSSAVPASASSPSTPSSVPTSSSGRSLRSPKPVHHLPSPPLGNHVPIAPKHGIHVATLHLRSHTTELEHLTFFTSFALRAARALGLPTSGVIALPTKTSLFTVPRSPFAHKKSQENFWRKEHKRAIKVYDGNEEIVQAWLAYLRKEAMGGVGMKAQVITYRPVGWGKAMVGTDSLRQSAIMAGGEDAAKVMSLAQELVEELKEMVDETEKVQVAQSLEAGDVQAAASEPVVMEVEVEVVAATEAVSPPAAAEVQAAPSVEAAEVKVNAPEPVVAKVEAAVEPVVAAVQVAPAPVVEAKVEEAKVEASEPTVVEPVVVEVIEPVVVAPAAPASPPAANDSIKTP